jgi:caffeoyl-CoA O-methyltransferase
MPFASGRDRSPLAHHPRTRSRTERPARALAWRPMARGGLEPTEELLAYLSRWGARTDEVLDRVRAETAERPDAAMQVAPDQGALMELIVRLIGAKDALEVGTFTGYSAICIARGLGEDGRLTCLELDQGFAATAQRNIDAAGVGDRVEIRIGSARESLEAIPAEPAFDVAFIDADKPGYPEYYELVLERMRPGGLILLDNMLQGGRVVAPDTESARVIDALNRRIHADERVDMAMTLAADGLTFVRVR